MSTRAMLSNRRMKDYRLLIVLSAAIFLSSQSAWGADLQLKAVSAKKNSLSVVVDPRMELLSIVQHLSDYRTAFPDLVTERQFPYRKDVDEWFSRSKDHPVLEMFSRMSSKEFNYDAPPHSVLYLNPDLSLAPVIFKDERFDVKRAGGKEQMTAFAEALKAFAEASDFPEFYKNHVSFYRQITEETMKTVGGNDNIGQLEQYYGEKRNSYSVIISPLFGYSSFGPQTERKKGVKDIYFIMGPTAVRSDIPVFGTTSVFDFLQRHEFSHSFVNPLTDKHWDLANKYSDLFAPMEEKMEEQAYEDWKTVVNESIIRAVTSRLAYRIDGREAGDKELQGNKHQGFVFTDALASRLEEYERNRDKYPTLDSYYPELIKAFDGFSQASVRDLLPKEGFTVNQQVRRGTCVVYEIPQGEGNADAVSYVTQMHERVRFWSGWELVDASKLDESALKEKLKNGFVLYTTIGSRLFKAATKPLDIKIEGGVFDWNGVREPVGELRLILIGNNPYGEGYCSVYAGGSTRLLPGINGIPHGLCSYHIIRGDNLLKEGHYNEEFASTDSDANGDSGVKD